MNTHKGLGRAIFAATLLGIGGVLNTEFIFGSLNTWGWLTLVLGLIQLAARGRRLGSLLRAGRSG